MNRITVIGAGVVGVASAYALCRAGYKVLLLEKNSTVAGEASKRNGAQLSYAYGDAMASPALLKEMPSILLGRDPSFNIKMQLDPDFLIWGLRFILNCNRRSWSANTEEVLNIAQQSRVILETLLKEFSIDFSYKIAGKMHLYSNQGTFNKARASLQKKRNLNIRQQILTSDEGLTLEPALAHYNDHIHSIIYTPDDAVGNPVLFCQQMTRQLIEKYDLDVRFNTEVVEITSKKNKVQSLKLSTEEELSIDKVVLCTGNSHYLLSKLLCSYGSIWPIQGYSLTVDQNKFTPKISITDVKRKIVFAKLSQSLRIAGLADIVKRDLYFSDKRFNRLVEIALDAFPKAVNLLEKNEVHKWTHARPSTPSSVPIIQRGKLGGSYINMGHGMLGWTLSLGAGQRLCDLVKK